MRERHEQAELIANAALIFQDALKEALVRTASNSLYAVVIQDIVVEIADAISENIRGRGLDLESVVLLAQWAKDLAECVQDTDT